MNNTTQTTPIADCNSHLLVDSSDSHRFSTNVAIIVLNSPFAVFAVLANLLVLITVKKTKELHIPANILLCGLAFTDLLVGLLVQPLFIAWRLLLHYRSTVCQPAKLIHSLYEGFLMLCVGGSFVVLSHLSTDRVIAVMKPLKYRAQNSIKLGAAALVVLLVLWSLFPLLRIFVFSEDTGAKVTSAVAFILALYLLGIQIFLLVGIRRNNRHVHSLHEGDHNTAAVYRRERRAAVTITLIFLALLVLLVPVVVVQIAIGYTSANADQTEMYLALSAVLINSSVNPLIYFLRNTELRKSALRLLGSWKKNRTTSTADSPKSSDIKSLEETL